MKLKVIIIFLNFCRTDDGKFGQFIAEMLVVVDKEEYEAKAEESMSVEKALKDTARGGNIGGLKIDPQSLTMRAPGT